ncbi:MAG: glycoside hydrolase family 97 protein, partial [Duncaniella sp.]|nr:glycoside hydrolase family 97 protein [Duncaniella sp.]
MRIFKHMLSALCCFGLFSAAYAVDSPGGRLSVKSTRDGLTLQRGDAPLFRVLCGNVAAIGSPVRHSVNYTMLTGKKKHCTNAYIEQSYRLAQGDTLILRVYDDGFAWKKPGMSRVEFVRPAHTWLQQWTDCYEGFFPKDRQLSDGMRIGYPALVEYKDGVFGLLTESGIASGEAGVSMHARGGNVFDLIPDGPEDGGWQTFITGTLSDVVESTLVTDNSAPCVLADTSWIEPGVASWVYWAYNHGSNDYDIIAKYVDLAAALRLPYVLIDAEWDTMKDGKTIEDAVAYALSKGVRPMIWYNSSIGWVDGAPTPKFRLNTPESLEKEFAWCEKIGVKGVKIDFFSGDTNRNMKFMTELLEAAARHGLLVNFHGSPLPRGWQRTYPNFITTESVYGAEWYNNVPTFTDQAAAHNATLPFTRNVIGSMDYTPCAFSDSQHPHITTHVHELALTALFESGIQHLADRPESLLAQPREVRDYFGSLPTAWDETLLLGGYPGEYVIMARRKGSDWWISAINGTDRELKNIKIDYSRLGLPATGVDVRIFEDAVPGSADKWSISNPYRLPDTISMYPRGGVVMTVKCGPVVTGDFRDFGVCRSDTVITLDCGELKTDNRNPLFYADYRDGVEVSFNVRFNTFLTEQAVVCREAMPGSKTGVLTVGFDPGTNQIFAEVMDADGTPRRIVAGPDVKDSRTYAVRVTSSADRGSDVTSSLSLCVYPIDSPVDSVLKENNVSMTYRGDALPYLPGNWIVGHGYPGGFPNSLQLR